MQAIREVSLGHEEHKNTKPIYVDHDIGPKIYEVKGNIVTPTLITKNLPDQFSSLPIYGCPNLKSELPEFYRSKLREFVGHDLNDEDFNNLSKYCSPDHLRTGEELQMSTNFPITGLFPSIDNEDEKKLFVNKKKEIDKINGKSVVDKVPETSDRMKLCIHKKLQLRIKNDNAGLYTKRLKYRGVRILPFPTEDACSSTAADGELLEPGKDILIRVRIYRPYSKAHTRTQSNLPSARQSVFSCDAVLVGRQGLAALRDRFVCANDVGLRLDHSDDPDRLPHTHAKTLFPSGFLFINNVFYVDTRDGCSDHSGVIRAWAERRGMGRFPVRDLRAVTLHDVPLRLGHPEVYVHQGNCEHLFTFSEVRLLGPRDPALGRWFPLSLAHSQHHSVYCTTCAEFGAKWIVAGCRRVPFDPAFFCDTCLKLYLYVDGKKAGDFKAYSYRGNELNVLKP